MMKFWSNENSSASMLHDSIFSRKVCKKSQRGQTAPPELLYSQMHLSFFCKDYDLKKTILQLFFSFISLVIRHWTLFRSSADWRIGQLEIKIIILSLAA